ncbi:MAG: nitrate reductase [Anaerolineaceae bacterium]|nr:nitrate reductase [Anaerolineaceae bacterium]
MSQMENPVSGSMRVLVIGALTVIVVLGLALIAFAVNSAISPNTGPVNALANSDDSCVTCHRNVTPGIIEQYGHSTMAAADVRCVDCHEVTSDYPGAYEHEGTYILGSPTTAMCQGCHEAETAQYYASRHALPAYAAVFGTEGLSQNLLDQYAAIPEGSFAPDKSRNAIAALEGPDMTRFTCEGCHNVGKPALDESVGQCQKCHLRHEFSLEQARRPETCNACHIGPDHPQWEIYQESPHGIAYATMGDSWNWDADPGTLTTADFPAPTCATCHMSGFGAAGTTHDVGDRLTWYLFAPISARRPAYQDNAVRMQNVCRECHNENFIDSFYADADKMVDAVNAWVVESDDIMQPLKDQGLLTAAAFDEPVDFTYFDLWHHWGRTAKFGAWMQGPDYSQWHGAYEMLRGLAELRAEVTERLNQAVENVEASPESSGG